MLPCAGVSFPFSCVSLPQEKEDGSVYWQCTLRQILPALTIYWLFCCGTWSSGHSPCPQPWWHQPGIYASEHRVGGMGLQLQPPCTSLKHLLCLWHMIAAPGDLSPFSCAFKGARWNMVEGMLPGPWLLQSLLRGEGRAAPSRGDLEVYKHKLRVYTTTKACSEGCSTLLPCRLPHSHEAFSENAFLGLQDLSIYWLHGWVYLMYPKCWEL